MEKEILFTEVQKFRQWWLWLILILASLPLLGILVYQVVTGQPVGDKPAPNSVLALLVIFISAPMLLGFFFIKLFTIIDQDTIYYGFGVSTSNLNAIHLADITSMDVVPYKSNGLGMRLSNEFGTIYNTSGGMGLFITNNKGSKMVIGTKKPEELKAAISKMKQ
jgi:hypothetical protein